MNILVDNRTPDSFLTAQLVLDTYGACMRPETAEASRVTQVRAWMMRHTFSMRRLVQHRENVIKMLLCLPAGFRTDVGGGGWLLDGFLRADGTRWTDDFTHIERLVALGLALHLVEFCSPPETWTNPKIAPGGAPYFRIMITQFGVTVN